MAPENRSDDPPANAAAIADLAQELQGLKALHTADKETLTRLFQSRIEGVRKEIVDAVSRAEAQHETIIQRSDAEHQAIRERMEVMESVRREMKDDTARSVSAALVAAKEFVAQQNSATKEEVNSLAANWATGHAALGAVVDDIKMRVSSLEAIRIGGRQTSATFYAIFGVMLTVIWIAITLLALYHK